MNDIVIFAIILIGVGVLFIAKTIIIVSQSDIYVVERLGKFSRELNAGLPVSAIKTHCHIVQNTLCRLLGYNYSYFGNGFFNKFK
jgi:ABC-type taurine transport system ATPase subunit